MACYKWPDADEGHPDVIRARARFAPGDRVAEQRRGWHGVVCGEASDNAILWCDIKNVGRVGIDPRKLEQENSNG